MRQLRHAKNTATLVGFRVVGNAVVGWIMSSECVGRYSKYMDCTVPRYDDSDDPPHFCRRVVFSSSFFFFASCGILLRSQSPLILLRRRRWPTLAHKLQLFVKARVILAFCCSIYLLSLFLLLFFHTLITHHEDSFLSSGTGLGRPLVGIGICTVGGDARGPSRVVDATIGSRGRK